MTASRTRKHGACNHESNESSHAPSHGHLFALCMPVLHALDRLSPSYGIEEKHRGKLWRWTFSPGTSAASSGIDREKETIACRNTGLSAIAITVALARAAMMTA